MARHISPPGAAAAAAPTGAAEPSSITLADYLAAVASAVRAGLPARSWIEATVVAAKVSSYGHSLQLVEARRLGRPTILRRGSGSAARE